MKKRKLLAALLLCTAVALPIKAYSAEKTFEGTYQGVQKPSENGGVIFNNTGDTAIVKAGTQFINNEAKRGAGIYNYVGGNLNIEDNVKFDNNRAVNAAGGAVQNFGTAVMGDNLVFENNKATWGGAAIYAGSNSNGGHSTTVGNGAIFRNNSLTANKSYGGAIFVEDDNKSGNAILSLGSNSTFENNSAMHGGAVFISSPTVTATIGSGATFKNNTATNDGGAIYNVGTLTIGNNVLFRDNKIFEESETGHGSDIFNNKGTIVIGDNATFERKEIPDYHDCGIYSPNGGSITIGNNATFRNIIEPIVISGSTTLTMGNNAHFDGNIYGIDLWSAGNVSVGDNFVMENGINRQITIEDIFSETLTIGDGFIFRNNTTSSFSNIYNGTKSTIHFLGSSEFTNNSAPNGNVGVIQNWNQLVFDGKASFVNNHAGGDAGALINRGENSNTVFNSTVEFIGNSAGGNGGAIVNQGSLTFNDVALFEGNSAGADGGAIHTITELSLTDADFINNSAGAKGGAIFTSSDLSISAVTKDVVFKGNKATEGNDIFMNTAESTLVLNASEGKSITLASGISGNKDGYNILINNRGISTFAADTPQETVNYTGSVIINSAITNATVGVDSGMLHLAQGSSLDNSTVTMASGTTLNTVDNKVTTFGNDIILGENVNLIVDVNVTNGEGDNFANVQKDGKVTITAINPIGSANTNTNNISVDIAKAVGLDKSQLAISDALLNQTQTVLTPIRYLQGGISETGLLTMAPTGNNYKDFNPAVMASPIAAQLGGYLTQLNSYDQAFRNMDMYMLMTKKQREAMKLRNKYAAADSNLVFDPLGTQYDDKAVWVRPYATFENVPLKGGPRVSNVAYGSFFGADSELYDLGHGWDGMLSVYASYNGSHQAYDGIGIYQNGGTLGITGMAYKGNFFTGLTLNAGANVGEANTVYGNDNFTMLMAGIANKTGYNIELADGKFIIQPNVQLSYSFVNTFDYTNAAGVKINSDPLNTIQVEPGIKFIGNLKNGWQPYAGVSVVWNIMDKTDFHANNVSLPELSVKPYVRYGVGVRKTWGEICTGFLQTYFTNGGRNGVGLQAGFRFTLGKGGLNSIKSSNNIPELPKTKINLSSAR